MKTKTNIIRIGVYSFNERELSQLIRRKMITKARRNKNKYTRQEYKKF